MSPLLPKKQRSPKMSARRHRVRSLCRKAFSLLCILPLLLSSGGCSHRQPPSETKAPSDSASFSTLLDDFFREYATSDSLSLHYTIQNPEALFLKKPAVSLGQFGEASLQASWETATKYLARLHTFSKEALEPEEQLTYDLLDYALEHSVPPEGTVLYDSPLGPTTGLQTQLPILLAEYRFSSLEDVEDYFSLLEDLPRYFSELCAFEKARSLAGVGSCAEVLSRILLQCSAFVEDPGNNFLTESFQDRLTALPELTSAQTADLCIRNQKLVFTCVIPAYEALIETLTALQDTSVPARGLAALPGGIAYYEYLVKNNTGSDRTIDEMEAMLQDALLQNMLTMITLYESETLREELKTYQKQGLSVHSEASAKSAQQPDKSIFDEARSASVSVSEYSSELLAQLRTKIGADFPKPAEASYRVQTIHPSLEDFISPALYLVPPLDAYQENVIYINKEKCSFESLFSTLAHEGYPGHLYQNTYFAASSPHPARMLLNFTGYDEGWGTYAELYSYHYADCSEELKQFLTAEQVAGLALYSLSDIRIHYHGDSLETVTAFLQEYGFSAETAEEIFYTQLAEPAIYLPYSIGYLEFCSLRDQYLSLTGADASLLPFHTFLLETGPAPFPLLKERLLEAFS